MLYNIKTILGITKYDYDAMITLFIDKVTKRVQGYCNIEDIIELPQAEQDALNEFIEDKVCHIIAYKLSQIGESVSGGYSDLASQGAIKSISRGSVRIEYNTDSNSSSVSSATTKSSLELANDEKEYLNSFRRCRFF